MSEYQTAKAADDAAHAEALRVKRVETAKAIARNIKNAIEFSEQHGGKRSKAAKDDAAHEMVRGAAFAAEAMGNHALQQLLGQWLILGTGCTGYAFIRDTVLKGE